MKIISSLRDLDIPDTHKSFLSVFINNIKCIPQVKRVILFGSCAREDAAETSDVDIVVIRSDVSLEVLLAIYDCAPSMDDECYVAHDIIDMDFETYEKYKNTRGMVQRYVENEGVDLSGFLQ